MINVRSLFKHNKLRPVAIGRNERAATGLAMLGYRFVAAATLANMTFRRVATMEKLSASHETNRDTAANITLNVPIADAE